MTEGGIRRKPASLRGRCTAKKGMQVSKRIAAALFCAVIALSCVAAPALAAGKTTGEPLTVGVPADRCPIFCQDPDSGEPVGIGVDLVKFWAAKSLENLSNDEAIGCITADRFVVLRHIAEEGKMHEDERNVLEPVQKFFINQGKKNAAFRSGISLRWITRQERSQARRRFAAGITINSAGWGRRTSSPRWRKPV